MYAAKNPLLQTYMKNPCITVKHLAHKKGKILKRKYRISYKSCGDIIGVFILRFDFSGTFLRWNNQCCHFCELYCWQKFVTVLPPATKWNSTNVQIFVTYVCVYKISSCQFEKRAATTFTWLWYKNKKMSIFIFLALG